MIIVLCPLINSIITNPSIIFFRLFSCLIINIIKTVLPSLMLLHNILSKSFIFFTAFQKIIHNWLCKMFIFNRLQFFLQFFFGSFFHRLNILCLDNCFCFCSFFICSFIKLQCFFILFRHLIFIKSIYFHSSLLFKINKHIITFFSTVFLVVAALFFITTSNLLVFHISV